jgi:hypothetical protein
MVKLVILAALAFAHVEAQVLPVASGGTATTNASQAPANLGAVSAPLFTATSMEMSATPWSICDAACAGGSGGNLPSVGPTQIYGVASPSLNNHAMEVSFTATANTTDVLFVSKPTGAYNANANKFTMDVWFYPTNSTGVDEHEFDQGMATAGTTEWMFGHQCVVGGTWDIWNQLALGWVSTSAECTQLTPNVWHHVVFYDYKIPGDATGCGGYGCLYFGSLTVDNVLVYSLNQAEPAGPTPGGWASFAFAQVQEDVETASTGSPVAVVSYYNLFSFAETQ